MSSWTARFVFDTGRQNVRRQTGGGTGAAGRRGQSSALRLAEATASVDTSACPSNQVLQLTVQQVSDLVQVDFKVGHLARRRAQSHGCCLCRPKHQRHSLGLWAESELLLSRSHLDVELQVLVHGVDVVKDVPGDTRDDSHQRGVVEVPLETQRGGQDVAEADLGSASVQAAAAPLTSTCSITQLPWRQ